MESPSFLDDFGASLPQLWEGMQTSLILTGLSLLVGLPLALIAAVGLMSDRPWRRVPAVVLVEVGRGAPALVLLQVAYYGLPVAGVVTPALLSATCALSWTTAAYGAEYMRGGLAAVPRGEVEGCQALGMTPTDTFRFVILPQGLRIATPSLMGFAVMLFQATALAFSVAVPELMSQAYSIGSSNFRYLNVLVAAGVLYAAVSIPCTWLSVVIERRMARHTTGPA